MPTYKVTLSRNVYINGEFSHVERREILVANVTLSAIIVDANSQCQKPQSKRGKQYAKEIVSNWIIEE